MKKARPTLSKKAIINQAARMLGKLSWKARVKRYGLKKLKQKLSEAGRNATGRPRLPDDKVNPASLYQRARRERLRAKATLERSFYRL